MTITVVGNDIHDLGNKLGLRGRYDITIRLKIEINDWGRDRKIIGCVVDATNVGEITEVFFPDNREAGRYVSQVLERLKKEQKDRIMKADKEAKNAKRLKESK